MRSSCAARHEIHAALLTDRQAQAIAPSITFTAAPDVSRQYPGND